MVTKRPALADCPTCRATGRVESRLPFRQKTCEDCGGKARITPARREQILKRQAEKLMRVLINH
jgi:DnaJ-class molecular chaperone